VRLCGLIGVTERDLADLPTIQSTSTEVGGIYFIVVIFNHTFLKTSLFVSLCLCQSVSHTHCLSRITHAYIHRACELGIIAYVLA